MPGKQRDLEISVVQKLKQEEATISKELQRYRDRDPVVLKALSESTSFACSPETRCSTTAEAVCTGNDFHALCMY